MLSLASQLEQNRFRSGTSPGTSAASGSLSGSGGRALSATPDARRWVDAVEEVDRVLRVDLVERLVPAVAVCATVGSVAPSGARPQTVQKPSSIVPSQPGRRHASTSRK
jgi:hypothetical protein